MGRWFRAQAGQDDGWLARVSRRIDPGVDAVIRRRDHALPVESRCDANIESIKEGIDRWPGGEDAAQRKKRLFNDRLLGLALGRLVQFVTY